MNPKLRQVVNGTLMQQFVGQAVSVFGFVSHINRTGTSFDIRTTDNVTVTVNLQEPLTDNLEGVVEVIGTCTTKNSVTADQYIQFDAIQCNDFNVDGANQAVLLLNTVPQALDIGGH